MALPENGRIFDWAQIDTDTNGEPLKAFAPDEIARTGLLVGEPWPRVWHNQSIGNFGKWIRYLSGLSLDENGTPTGGAEPIGYVRMMNTTKFSGTFGVTEANELWPGNWELTGTQTFGADTITYFTKTSY